MVVALFAKAGSNGGAFLLNDGTLVGNSLCGAHIADELFHWNRLELAGAESDWKWAGTRIGG